MPLLFRTFSYIQQNVRSLRSYADVPDYLQQHTIPFAMHCKGRLIRAEAEFEESSIVPLASEEGQFLIASASAADVYKVDITVPFCSCQDWTTRGLPCKHMVSVFKHGHASWDELEESYRSSVHNVIDNNFLNIPCREHLATLENVQMEIEQEEENPTVNPEVTEHEGSESHIDECENESQPILESDSDKTNAEKSHDVPQTTEDETISSSCPSSISKNFLPNSVRETQKLHEQLLEVSEVFKSLCYDITETDLMKRCIEMTKTIVQTIHSKMPGTAGIQDRINTPKKATLLKKLPKRIRKIKGLLKPLQRRERRTNPRKGRRYVFNPIASQDVDDPDTNREDNSSNGSNNEATQHDTSDISSIFSKNVTPRKIAHTSTVKFLKPRIPTPGREQLSTPSNTTSSKMRLFPSNEKRTNFAKRKHQDRDQEVFAPAITSTPAAKKVKVDKPR